MIIAVLGEEAKLLAKLFGDALEGVVVRASVDPEPGLGDVLAGEADLESVCEEGVCPHGWGLDRPRHLRQLPAVLERLGRHYPHIVIACPAAPAHTRNALCFVADLIVLGCGGETPIADAMATRERLMALETPLGGVFVIDEESTVDAPTLPVTATAREDLPDAVEDLVAALTRSRRAVEPFPES
ncbi:MAG: hypothetical protein U5K37_12420 [Natrialbaceae archaeon]|nr:hypothetical protein [Natrialbaceae archaeon]